MTYLQPKSRNYLCLVSKSNYSCTKEAFMVKTFNLFDRKVADNAISQSKKTAGFWSAVLATVFSLMYDISQIGEWMGLMGAGGGPENASAPPGLAMLLTPSLFSGPSFLILVVSTHNLSSPDIKIRSHSAVVFATIYAALNSINYYVQLGWVMPRLASCHTRVLILNQNLMKNTVYITFSFCVKLI